MSDNTPPRQTSRRHRSAHRPAQISPQPSEAAVPPYRPGRTQTIAQGVRTTPPTVSAVPRNRRNSMTALLTMGTSSPNNLNTSRFPTINPELFGLPRSGTNSILGAGTGSSRTSPSPRHGLGQSGPAKPRAVKGAIPSNITSSSHYVSMSNTGHSNRMPPRFLTNDEKSRMDYLSNTLSSYADLLIEAGTYNEVCIDVFCPPPFLRDASMFFFNYFSYKESTKGPYLSNPHIRNLQSLYSCLIYISALMYRTVIILSSRISMAL
jgi:hypothetical protein